MTNDEPRAEYRRLLGEQLGVEEAIAAAEVKLATLVMTRETNTQKLEELRSTIERR